LRLTFEQVSRASRPSVDPDGILFDHDGRLLRAFRGEAAERLRHLEDRERLWELGLCRFEEVPVSVEGFDLVIEVERIQPVTYPQEWPTRMLKEAALLTLRLHRELLKQGLALKDAHPWNVVFSGPRPVFVDLGSIASRTTHALLRVVEFRREMLLPLQLSSWGLHGPAERITREHRAVAKKLWDMRPLKALIPPALSIAWLRHRSSPEALVDALIEHVSSLDASGRKMTWSSYDQKPIDVGARELYDQKKRTVDRMLGTLRPGTVLDMACNLGWFSELAVSHGNAVSALDVDDFALGVLYDAAAARALPILPVRMDVLWPTGSFGMALAFDDAYTRLQADTVMALAVLHHLCRNQHVRFELFAKVLDRLAREAAIVEFIPAEDVHVSRWPLATQPWYTIDHLIACIRPYFPEVDVQPSSPEPRKLLLFRRTAAFSGRR
jgi:hypothetical protein